MQRALAMKTFCWRERHDAANDDPISSPTTDLAAALRGAVRALARSGIHFSLDLSAVASSEVIGDPKEWERALSDMVRNAAIVTPAGGKVAVVLRRSMTGLCLTITDHGCGVAGEDLPAIATGPALDRIRGLVERAGGALWL